MDPFHGGQVTGLTLDIMGAFLVAVEAIKLENLRKLRDRLFEPVHRATLSPRIEWIDGRGVSSVSNTYLAVYMSLHYLAGLAIFLGADALSRGRILDAVAAACVWVWAKPWYVVLLAALGGIVYGVVVGLWMLGELLHMGITQLTKWPLVLLTFIDVRTPDGTVGAIGFLILFVGFVLQFLGTYLVNAK